MPAAAPQINMIRRDYQDEDADADAEAPVIASPVVKPITGATMSHLRKSRAYIAIFMNQR
jgi:hypothetical protein